MISIRPIAPKDKHEWWKLWCDPDESYLQTTGSLASVSPSTTETTFSRFLDPRVPLYAAVAQDSNGNLIGFATYLTHLGTKLTQENMYLGDLYVSPSNRQKGAGRKLLEFVFSEADRLNCPGCFWTTDKDNQTAQRLYNKVGVQADFVLYRRA
ncbi:D-amino-acid N-acetyltransferase [Yamadazyma tenuis]|uniref:N-acetyltransferase HPA3 n=1 Tax=Candida tenuis (strain ATCC 10573 / BCRC 21748 / CBS 615 / JCM 9827 / NBRC 10315 / NRRL Y-1498 / VKM Y-70) TaxID=590646 RepID=G3AZP4_CANTC|nr:N-acetyltransferase HPA3 [Yamadazyma tenuis ATCC 10573]XP_006684682.1 uncharacterized protein CANTEDRAFT_112509 [Yamadazyma tenuis ATCC 10573]EGV66107.1 N-acetyltransferase HPA3 [Yamadazyma tenuis ATCC 10573]EGV66108.1 hypothetical protein CANTEDRAFT_112509 [Yamadazyma tenuis ATCC 10573]WEJ96055.1 D-amino-acid N-acetyltransferase [Yamadazyma tenuis]